MKLLLLTLALCLLPWTIRAQDGTETWDSVWVEPPSMEALMIHPIMPVYQAHWEKIPPPDSNRTFTLGQVRRMIDSAVAAQGRWERLIRYDCYPAQEGFVIADTMRYPQTCTTWVWTRPGE